MGRISNKHAPKVFLQFIIKQMTVFITSKEFKKRVMDFLFNVVDDVVSLAYDNAKKSESRKS